MRGVNSSGIEYAQGLIGENVLVVRPAVDGNAKDKTTQANFFDLFQWDAQSGRWTLLPYSLNTEAHEGSACWSEADQMVIFSRNHNLSEKARNDRAGLFFWSNGQDTVTAFPHNDMGRVLCHPTVSADGQLLLFAADIPGGFGGMDLYYSVKNEHGWGEPVNLGAAINTAGNELFPFLHRSGTLFYSSDGMESLGNLDLFRSTPVAGVWQRPFHLPEPFNSEGDDFSLWLNALGTDGFMSSNRKDGAGADDIYSFSSNEPLFIEVTEAHDIEVLSRQGMTPVAGAEIVLQFNTGWNSPYRMKRPMPTEAPKPWQQARLLSNSTGLAHLGLSESLWIQATVRHPEYQEKTEILRFDPEHLWHQILLDPVCVPFEGIVATADGTEGISGITGLLADTAGHIIDTVATDSLGVFSLCLTAGRNYRMRFTGKGWIPLDADAWTMPNYSIVKKWYLEKDPVAEMISALTEGPIVKGSVFVFDQIYYDYNDSEIRADATAELDVLAARMNELPSMRIELIAHTDSRGKGDYNLRLSVARAEAAKRYLVRSGVAAERIMAVGYGENQLRNHCSDGVECSESEHAYNRRTEIKVLSIE